MLNTFAANCHQLHFAPPPRCLYRSPSRAYRQEGVPETEEAAQRATGYEEAIFRSLQAGRRQAEVGGLWVDCRVGGGSTAARGVQVRCLARHKRGGMCMGCHTGAVSALEVAV
jgi:hypothetical protein